MYISVCTFSVQESISAVVKNPYLESITCHFVVVAWGTPEVGEEGGKDFNKKFQAILAIFVVLDSEIWYNFDSWNSPKLN